MRWPLGRPSISLGARLGGPTTAGVNELAVEPERVELAGLVTRGDMAAPDTGPLMNLGDGDAAVTDDCSVEVLIGVLGEGL